MHPLMACCALLLVLAAPPPDAGAVAPAVLPLDGIIQRLQKNYDGAHDFRARFSQRYTNLTFGRTRLSTGEVLFKKPGRMRWNYDSPAAKVFLATGQVLWLYEPEDAQAFKQDLKSSQLPAALAFLMGKGKLSDEFEFSLAGDAPYGGPGALRLLLKPKQPQASYKSIFFVVDPKTFLVTESVLVDSQGNVNDIKFSELKLNSKIPDRTFVWAPPAGVRVIDSGKLRN